MNTTNAKLRELAKRYDTGEFTDAQYLAEITKAVSAPEPDFSLAYASVGTYTLRPNNDQARQVLDIYTLEGTFRNGSLVLDEKGLNALVRKLRNEGFTVQ